MSKITIFAIVAFVLALSTFLIYDFTSGFVKGKILDTTTEAVKESKIEDSHKAPILGTFSIIKLSMAIGTVFGVILLFKRFF